MFNKIQSVQSPFPISSDTRAVTLQSSEKENVCTMPRYSKSATLFLSIFTPMLKIQGNNGAVYYVRRDRVANYLKNEEMTLPLKRGMQVTDALSRLYIRVSAVQTSIGLDLLPTDALGEVLKYFSITDLLSMSGINSIMRAKVNSSPLWGVYAQVLGLQVGKRKDASSLEYKGMVLECMQESFKKDCDEIPPALFQDNGFVRKYINSCSIESRCGTIQSIHPSLFDDKDVVLAILKRGPFSLQHVSDRLRDDKEIALIALDSDVRAWSFISPRLRKKRKVLLKAIQNDCDIMCFDLPKKLCRDRGFILDAVKLNGRALQFVKRRFRDDEEIVLEAVKQNGDAFAYASGRLKNDKEFVLKAIQAKASAIIHMSPALWHDKEFMMKAIKQNIKVLQFVSNWG